MPAQFPNQYSSDTVARFLDLGTTGQVANATGAFLTGCIVSNVNATARYLKIYNKATAATGSDTPVMTILIPATSVVNLGDIEIPFSNGIGVRATTGVADNDTGAPSANDIIAHVLYRG